MSIVFSRWMQGWERGVWEELNKWWKLSAWHLPNGHFHAKNGKTDFPPFLDISFCFNLLFINSIKTFNFCVWWTMSIEKQIRTNFRRVLETCFCSFPDESSCFGQFHGENFQRRFSPSPTPPSHPGPLHPTATVERLECLHWRPFEIHFKFQILRSL